MNNLNDTITTNENTLLIYKANINFEIKKFISEFIIKNNNVYFNYCIHTDSGKNTNHFKKLAKLDFFNNDFTPFINFIDINFFDFITQNDIIEYTKTKDNLIRKLSGIILDKYKSKFWEIFQNYEVYKIEYNKIKNDKNNILWTRKRIKDALKDKKTATVTIEKNGKQFTFKTYTENFMWYSHTLTKYHITNIKQICEFSKLFPEQDEYTADEIIKITYKNKIIYEK